MNSYPISFTGNNHRLPPKDIFSKSLYIFDIGQNDFTGNLAALGIQGVKQYLPRVASQIAWTIKVTQLPSLYILLYWLL